MCYFVPKGRLSEATNILASSVKANPKHAASWVALGKIYERSSSIGSLGNNIGAGMSSKLNSNLKAMKASVRMQLNKFANSVGGSEDAAISSDTQLSPIMMAVTKCRQCYEVTD